MTVFLKFLLLREFFCPCYSLHLYITLTRSFLCDRCLIGLRDYCNPPTSSRLGFVLVHRQCVKHSARNRLEKLRFRSAKFELEASTAKLTIFRPRAKRALDFSLQKRRSRVCQTSKREARELQTSNFQRETGELQASGFKSEDRERAYPGNWNL